MAITLYNPKTAAFVSYELPVSDLPLSELLLLNILIELQTLAQIMSDGGSDNPADLRTDIVSI